MTRYHMLFCMLVKVMQVHEKLLLTCEENVTVYRPGCTISLLFY